MPIKIYAEDNYVLIDDGHDVFEYAKGYTLYTLKRGIYTIKETQGGEYNITQAQLSAGDIVNESSVAYSESTFVTFLRQNTGFKTAAGGSAAYDYLEVPISSAQIKAMGSSPIQLLPAAGVNKYYVFERIVIEFTYSTAAYVFPTSQTFYLDGAFDAYVDKLLFTSASNGVTTLTGNIRNTITVGSGSGSVQVKGNRDVLNANLIMGTPSGDNPTTGSGTALVKIYYKTESFTL
jgi:hypothetical protein